MGGPEPAKDTKAVPAVMERLSLESCQDIPYSQGRPDRRARLRRKLCCSFCGKSESEVAKLAAGPGGIHICDACVEACRLFMSGTAALPRDFDPATWPTDRLVAALGPLNATAEAHREHLAKIVDTLRHREVSWAKIAEPLGVSRQTAWERFGGQ